MAAKLRVLALASLLAAFLMGQPHGSLSAGMPRDEEAGYQGAGEHYVLSDFAAMATDAEPAIVGIREGALVPPPGRPNAVFSIRNGRPSIWGHGSLHTLLGRVSLLDYIFDSDGEDPLRFRVDKELGYVYLGGSGTYTNPQGLAFSLSDAALAMADQQNPPTGAGQSRQDLAATRQPRDTAEGLVEARQATFTLVALIQNVEIVDSELDALEPVALIVEVHAMSDDGGLAYLRIPNRNFDLQSFTHPKTGKDCKPVFAIAGPIEGVEEIYSVLSSGNRLYMGLITTGTYGFIEKIRINPTPDHWEVGVVRIAADVLNEERTATSVPGVAVRLGGEDTMIVSFRETMRGQIAWVLDCQSDDSFPACDSLSVFNAFRSQGEKDQSTLARLAERHGCRHVRWVAVDRLDSSRYQDLLGQIARGDDDSEVRQKAASRLDDQEVLAFIIENDVSEQVRKAAVKRSSNAAALRWVTRNEEDFAVRSEAIRRLKDPTDLAWAGENDPWIANRILAYRLLGDEETLARFAKAPRNAPLGVEASNEYAAKAIEDQRLLADLALNAEDHEVRWMAVTRIENLALLAEIGEKSEDDSVRREARRMYEKLRE